MRLELIRPKSLPPQDSVSTNFTTSALHGQLRFTEGNYLSRSALSINYFGISFALESDSTGLLATSDVAETGVGVEAGVETVSEFTVSCITLPVVFGLLEAI